MSARAASPSGTPTVTLVPGSGVVIRKPAFVCVLGDASRPLLADILAIEESVAATDRMPRRGRHVVRAVAQLVATADLDETADIAFAAPDSVGIAVYLSGSVFGEVDGRRLVADGDEPFDRAIPWPYEGLGLYLSDTVPAEPGEETYDLVEGFVPAAGALLHTPLGLRGTEIHDLSAGMDAAAPADWALQGSAPPADSARQGPTPQGPGPSEVVVPPRSSPAPPEPSSAPEIAVSENDSPLSADAPHVDPIDVPDEDEGVELGSAPMPAASALFAESPESPIDFASSPLVPGMVENAPGAAVPLPPADSGPHPPRHPGARPEPGVGFKVDSLRVAVPEPRAPLPVHERQKPATEVVKIVESRTHVLGIRCSRGHLNHPRSWLCGVCGIRMDQLTGILVEGERPPLGWLLLDNGSTYLLDEDLVIGREPGNQTRPGRAGTKHIRVQDESGQLSRRHIEIRLVEWDVHVIDLGSANGTFVADPAMGGREVRLNPRQPHLLLPGSHVRIGGRHFIFESPHARA